MDLNIEKIKVELKNKGFSIIETGLTDLISKARMDYLGAFNQLTLHSPREPFTPHDLLQAPWRKLAIGSRNGIGEPYAQFLQTTYFHEQCQKYSHLQQLFLNMIQLRNNFLQLPHDFGSCPERDLFWNACRVHHYPSGGGFMMAHKDTHFPKALELTGFPFLQIMVPLSKKGEDFTTGGGFIVGRDTGQKHFFETNMSLGGIVLFDGSQVIHGVDDVDSDKIVNFQSESGRLAAFVNVYQVQ